MLEIPTLDTSLQLPLPRLLTPRVDLFPVAIEQGDHPERRCNAVA